MRRTAVSTSKEPPRCFETVDVRHTHVHQDHVGPQLPRGGNRFQPVARLAHDLDLRLGLEDHAESGTHERLVVDDQHLHAHARASRGRCAVTTNPPPCRGPDVIEPP